MTQQTAPRKRLIKRLLLAGIVLIIFVPAIYCGLIGWSFLNLLVLGPNEMRRAVKQYDRATLVFEESEPIFTNTEQQVFYYWTTDPINTVKATYEGMGLKFIAGTGTNDWWISTYNKNPLTEEIPTVSSPNEARIHRSVCEFQDQFNWDQVFENKNKSQVASLNATKTREFGCISVALVDASHPNLCRLEVLYPGNPPYNMSLTTPFEKCLKFPKHGTLIIINYYLESM